MPEMDGFELVGALRAEEAWHDIPIVVLTAKDVTEKDRARLAGSVTRIVLKDSDGIDEALRRACGSVLAALRPRAAEG